MSRGLGILFYLVLYMSFISTFVAVLIMIIRWTLGKKLSAFFNYALWSVLLIRLIVPMTFASESSMFNYLPNIINTQATYNDSKENIKPIEDKIEESHSVGDKIIIKESSVNNNSIIVIWIVVTTTLIIIFSISYMLSINKFKESIIYKSDEIDNLIKSCYKKKIGIYTVKWIDSPVVCGIFKPKIIVPEYITQKENKDILKAVVLHEAIHIKRKDNVIKLLTIFIACVHWFNPLIWISLVLSHNDMEKACDEKVMEITDGKFKKKYAEALLNFALDKNNILSHATTSFGESNIKKRIKGVLKYKEKNYFIKITTLAIFIATILVAITDASTNIVKINLNEISQNRHEDWVDLDDISPVVVQAAILSQDQNFYTHNGVDLIAIVRSGINSFVLKNNLQGASTITMQLIKNLSTNNNSNVLEKKRTQIYSAIQLEKDYKKDEIIEAYLNVVYYGRDIIGIKDASQYYFNKAPFDLTKEEAAKLIAVLDNPKEYDIIDEKENNERKASLIIKKINENNMGENNSNEEK